MEYEVIAFSSENVSLTLDWQSFSYAGKFEMTNTGKAVLREDGEIIAAAAFNGDRETPYRAWIRYLTVKTTRQGMGLGSTLAANVTNTLLDRGYETVTIAVNNPIAYRALYKAGFHFTGRDTGLTELVLACPGSRDPASYRVGLRCFLEHDRPETHVTLVRDWLADGSPPALVSGTPLPPSDQRRDNGNS